MLLSITNARKGLETVVTCNDMSESLERFSMHSYLCNSESEDAVDATDYWGRTPLLTAAAYGKKDAIECLSEGSGDRLDRVDNQQRSALFLTVEAGHGIAVKVSQGL